VLSDKTLENAFVLDANKAFVLMVNDKHLKNVYQGDVRKKVCLA